MHWKPAILLAPTILIATCLAAPPITGDQFAADPLTEQEENLTADRLVRMRLTADTAAITPDGRFHLAVVLSLAPHWHIYWRFAGEAGLPTELHVTAPEGYTVGETLYPRPSSFRETDGTTYGYEERVVLFVPVRAPATLGNGAVEFEVEASYLVCRGRCLMGDATRSITLPTTADAREAPAPVEGADAELLKQFQDRLPRPLKKLKGAEVVLRDDRLIVTGPCGGRDAVEFFPLETPGVRIAEAELTIQGDRFRLAVPFEVRRKNARGQPLAVAGVIGMGRKSDEPCYHLSVPLEGDPRP